MRRPDPPPRPRRGRRLATLARAGLLAGAAAACWIGATEAADQVEERSARDVRLALSSADIAWASVATSGLQVVLSGTAPDEAARFRAIAQAGAAVGPGRMGDRIQVARSTPAAPPNFRIELLRNDAGLSMIGLAPASSDRKAIAARLGDGAGKPAVNDLLESVDAPAPPGWDSALAFGTMVVQSTPRAKVSITPGRVDVTAVADSPPDKARLETELKRGKPADVALTMTISAPRPVIAPFTLRFIKDADGSRFDACAADDETARARIIDAAVAAGATGQLGCTLGLGAPSPRWADAAVSAIAAVADLGSGAVTVSDAEVALTAPREVPLSTFEEAAARLDAALPPVFRLHAEQEAPAAPVASSQPPVFTAERSTDGHLVLRGRVPDERMRNVVDSFARSRFDQVDSALRTDAAVPGGWTVRIIAALEAMADLASGRATVTADAIRLEGVSGSATASDTAAIALGRRLGAGADYSLAIRYDRRLDASLGLPDGQQCVDRGNKVLATSEIGFEPSGANIEGEVAPTIEALKAALTDCGAFRLEIGGHTDSQGSETFNQTLSRQRAAAVLSALRDAAVDTTSMVAVGYGETRPLASNDTDAGREANRRIEFRLIAPDPVETATPAPAIEIRGVTAAVKDTVEDAVGSSGAADQGAPYGPPAPASAVSSMSDLGQVPDGLVAPGGGDAADLADDVAVPDPELGLAGPVPQGYTGAAPQGQAGSRSQTRPSDEAADQPAR